MGSPSIKAALKPLSGLDAAFLYLEASGSPMHVGSLMLLEIPARQQAGFHARLVEHVRADGFTWKPVKAQDWMVCDMVESPRKVAARMSEWFAHGWCKHAVFNLKLPMKKRWDETRDCLAAFEAQAGRPLVVRARQLYHDREEVTVFATDPAARERDL